MDQKHGDIAFSYPAESVTITLSPQCCLEAMASISMKILGSPVPETLPHLALLASSFPSSLVSPAGRGEEHNQGRYPRPRTAAGLGQELSFLDSVPTAMTTVLWRFCLCVHQKESRWPSFLFPSVTSTWLSFTTSRYILSRCTHSQSLPCNLSGEDPARIRTGSQLHGTGRLLLSPSLAFPQYSRS